MFQNEQSLGLIPRKSTSGKSFDTGEIFKPAEVLRQDSETNSVDFRLSNIVFPFGLNGFSRFFYMENTHMTTSECGGGEQGGMKWKEILW